MYTYENDKLSDHKIVQDHDFLKISILELSFFKHIFNYGKNSIYYRRLFSILYMITLIFFLFLEQFINPLYHWLNFYNYLPIIWMLF